MEKVARLPARLPNDWDTVGCVVTQLFRLTLVASI